MPESASALENRPSTDSPDIIENQKEQLSPLEKKIEELRDLEGIIGALDLDYNFQNSESDLVVKKDSSVKTHVNKILDRIRQGYEGKLKGKDIAEHIKHVLFEGNLKEQDLTDRINNIYADLANLEERLQSAKTEDDISNSIQPIVDKYGGQDWPE
ncbi:MAG: hypothetical protein WDN47_03685 [Candidatus Doudnabacteria bacterium]